MIRNIVFDLGRVLVDFDPEGYLRALGLDDSTAQRLMQTVFGSEWKRYDRGDYPNVFSLLETLVRRFPQDEALLRRVLLSDWVKMHNLREDVCAYLLQLKARGYRVYLLSNLAKESYDYVSQFSFFSALDGGVFSYRERVCKPEAKIYQILLERYALQPDETLFLDDLPENVAAAERLGIHGIVFSTLPAVKPQVEACLNNP